MNKQNRNRLRDTKNRLIDARGEGIGELCETAKFVSLCCFFTPRVCRKIITRQTTSVNLCVPLGFIQLSSQSVLLLHHSGGKEKTQAVGSFASRKGGWDSTFILGTVEIIACGKTGPRE